MVQTRKIERKKTLPMQQGLIETGSRYTDTPCWLASADRPPAKP